LKSLVTILLLSILFAACSTIKYLPAETITTVKDSVSQKTDTLYRDTTIYLPGDSVEIIYALPCPDAVVNDYYESTGNVSLSIKKDSKGKVTINCKADSLKLVIDSLQTLIKTKEKFHSKETTKQVPYPVEVPKPYIPKWMWWALGISVAVNGFSYRKYWLKLLIR
jgi:hypothetical protein